MRLLRVCVMAAALLGAPAAGHGDEAPPSGAEQPVEAWAEDLGPAKETDVRRRAAYALWQLGPKAGAAALALAEALADADPYVRETVRKVCERIEFFAAMGAWQKTVPILARLVREDSRTEVRRAAAVLAWRISSVDPDLDRFLPLAEEFLEDPDAVVRANGAGILWHLGAGLGRLPAEVARRLRAALAKGLSDPDVEARLWAARGVLGLVDPEALPALSALLEDDDARVREAAVYAIGALPLPEGERRAETLRPIVRALRDRAPSVRVAAASTLGGWGTPAEAVPELEGALRGDADPAVLNATAYAIAASRRPEVLEVLLDALTSESGTARAAVLRWLHQLGAPTAPHLLAHLCVDSDPGARSAAAYSLAALGWAGRSAVPALLTRLRSPVAEEQAGAANALWILASAGVLEAADTPALLDALPGAAAEVQAAVLTSLAEVGDASERAVHTLAAVYDATADEAVRTHVVTCWAGQGPAARPCLDRIRSARDAAAGFRERFAALRALVAVSPDAVEREAALAELAGAVGDVARPQEAASALWVLGLLGPRAGRVAPALERAHAQEGWPAWVAGSVWAARVLVDPGLLARAGEAGSPSAAGRRALVDLVAAGAPAAGVAELLFACLDDPEPRTRRGALRALRRAGRTVDGALSPVAACLYDSDPGVRTEAENALASLVAAGHGGAAPAR